MMLTRAGRYWYNLIVTLVRDIQATFNLVDTQEAVFASRLGDYLLSRPIETRRQRLKVTVIGILYNVAAYLGRYLTSMVLSAALVAARLVIPITGFFIFAIGEVAVVYYGAQGIINSFTPYAEWQIHGIMHALHIVGTAVLEIFIVSLYTAAFLTSAIRYQKQFM